MTMSNTISNKNKKGKATTTPASLTTKMPDHNKAEPGKPGEKIQPTAEQLRMALIIDMKTEDPALKEKMREVMEATKKSEDEVFTALHDCDNDPNRAVNLLLEGTQSVWSTSQKKRKCRIPGDKKEPMYIPPNAGSPPPCLEDWDKELGFTSSNTNHFNPPRGRGGRGRARDSSDTKTSTMNNVSSQPERGRRGRLANGPSRGGRGGGRGGRGTFGRGRGTGQFAKRAIETWEPSALNHDEVSAVEDWDNEEYTGSLADSKVFTPSNAGSEPPTSESDDLIAQINNMSMNTSNSSQLSIGNSTEPPLSQDSLRTPTFTAAQYLTHLATSHNNVTNSNIPKSACSSVFREFSHDIESAPKFPSNTLARGTLRSSMLGLRSSGISNNSPEPSQPRRSQRIAPPKIPLTAVEMPPEADTSSGLLDVQFGALEYGESTPETIVNSISTPPQPSPSPTRPEQLSAPTSVSEGLLLSETSFSPVRNAVSTSSSLAQMSDLTAKSVDNTPISSSLYQEQAYQQSQFASKVTQPSSVYSSGTYTTNSQVMTSNTVSYNSGASQNSYSSSTSGGFYGTNSMPQYQPYSNYTSQQPSQSLSLSLMNTSNSYQAGVGSQQYSNSNSSAGYGSSGLGSSSYSTPYQPSYSSQHNHSKSVLSSNTSTSKEYDTPAPTVNLSTLSQSNSINVTHSLLSATQTTSSSKQTSMSSGVPPFLGPYVMNQGGLPFFQPQMYSYDDLQMMQATAPRMPVPGYYNIDYQQPTTREGVQYNLNDNRFARPDNTSPVQASSISQQNATQAHQPPLMNPTAIPPAYAYFYGGSMIPGNFQYGAALYHTAVPPAGASSAHGSAASSNVYGKGPGSYGTNYSGNYDQPTSGDYKSSSSQSQKQSSSQSVNPSTTADITMYSKSHSALSKISYDKQNYHCVTPPPFTLGSQNSGMGPGYPPSHLFIPSMTPHNTLLHQPLHQDSSSAVTGRSQVGNPQAKVGTKAYASSNYWTQN